MSRAIASARVCCSRAWPVGAERELAETVQRLGLAEPVAEITQQRQSPLVAGGGRRAFPGHLLQQTQAGAGPCLAVPVAEDGEQRPGVLVAADGGADLVSASMGTSIRDRSRAI